jgi:hypothetical protein
MKVILTEDEWFPVITIIPKGTNDIQGRYEADLTEVEYKRVKRALKNFEKSQEFLASRMLTRRW